MTSPYILIDTTTKDQVRLTFFGQCEADDFQTEASHRELLTVLDAALRQKRIEKESIRGIAVIVGAGSFTSTRLAVTVANTFAYVLQIPVISCTEEEGRDLALLEQRLSSTDGGQYISATYSSEPHIGS